APTSVGAAGGALGLFVCSGSCLPTLSVGLSGSGVSVTSADPNPLAFGDVPIKIGRASCREGVLVAGYGGGGVTGAGMYVRFSLDFGMRALIVSGVQSCALPMFAPTSVGAAGGALGLFVCSGSCLPTLSVGLSGSGVSVTSADPNPLAFGDVPI